MDEDFELIDFNSNESEIIMNDLDIHYEPIYVLDELKNMHYYNSRYYNCYDFNYQHSIYDIYAIQILKGQENGTLLYCLTEYGLLWGLENYINLIEFKKNVCFRSFERLVLYLEYVYMKD